MKTQKLNLLIDDMRLTIYERVGRAMVEAGSKGPVRAVWLWGAAFAKGSCGRPPGAPGQTGARYWGKSGQIKVN